MIVIALALSAASAGSAFAQTAPISVKATPTTTQTTEAVDPARLAAANRLLETTRYERTLDGLFGNLAKLMAEAAVGAAANDERSKTLVDALINHGTGGHDRLVAILVEELSTSIKRRYPELKAAAAREYAKAFTLEELTALNAFYVTPAGIKLLAVQPELQAHLSRAGQEIGRDAGYEAGVKGFTRALKEMLPEQNGKSAT
ncbi:MAG: DUF2059 domain-containing protein [Sphingomonas sp.]|jgi:hypothetical protein